MVIGSQARIPGGLENLIAATLDPLPGVTLDAVGFDSAAVRPHAATIGGSTTRRAGHVRMSTKALSATVTGWSPSLHRIQRKIRLPSEDPAGIASALSVYVEDQKNRIAAFRRIFPDVEVRPIPMPGPLSSISHIVIETWAARLMVTRREIEETVYENVLGLHREASGRRHDQAFPQTVEGRLENCRYRMSHHFDVRCGRCRIVGTRFAIPQELPHTAATTLVGAELGDVVEGIPLLEGYVIADIEVGNGYTAMTLDPRPVTVARAHLVL